MSITIPATDRTARASTVSEAGTSLFGTVIPIVMWIVVGFMIFIAIAAVIDKIIDVILPGNEISVVEKILAPFENFFKAVSNAFAAPFKGIAKIFEFTWYKAKPVGTAFYWIILVVVPLIIIVALYLRSRR